MGIVQGHSCSISINTHTIHNINKAVSLNCEKLRDPPALKAKYTSLDRVATALKRLSINVQKSCLFSEKRISSAIECMLEIKRHKFITIITIDRIILSAIAVNFNKIYFRPHPCAYQLVQER